MASNELTPLARALGRIPAGLFVVTTIGPDGPMGFVASLVQQFGFDPPTVAVAVGKGRDHLQAIREGRRFAVSIVDDASKHLMAPFFGKHPEGGTPFDALESHEVDGAVVLSDALAWLVCELRGEYATGDHTVVFGEVIEGHLTREADPKVHLRKNGLSY